MCDPEYILRHLTGGKKIKDIFIPGPIDHLVVHITQYLTNPAKFYLWPASSEKGFTREEIIRGACKMYVTVYLEEHESMLDLDVPRLWYRRGYTSGKYGIWGHDIGDLQLHTGHSIARTREFGVSMDS